MGKKFLLLLLILFFVFFLVKAEPIQSASMELGNTQSGNTQSGNTQSGNTQSGNTQSGNNVTLNNPLTSNDPAVIIGNVIKGILGLTGVLALVAFVAGGIMWMTSGGNPERVKKGRDILIWAVIGLFIVFSSYSILRYVFDVLA